jgi:hypothetical protein
MPTVKFDADTTALEAKIAGISNSTQQVGNAIEQKRMQLLSVYSHFTAISNIILHQIQKNLAGTEAGAAANVLLNLTQIGTTTASIVQTNILASTYLATNPGIAAFLFAQAGAMGVNLIQQQINKAEAEAAQRRIAAVRESYDRWS